MKLLMCLFPKLVAGVRPPFPTYFTEAEIREHSITLESWWSGLEGRSRYKIDQSIVSPKPKANLTTIEHAAWAQCLQDESNRMGLNSEPDCNGVQTDHPIRNLEWYYHGCFSQDVVDEIKRHPDTSEIWYAVTLNFPFWTTEAEAAKYRARDDDGITTYTARAPKPPAPTIRS